ncbi:hypothetical protein BDW22DRAFT_1363654 [Trametopsis cervina]|nr:hypothetical protein BDW22DRAFT_1363654 [Trametopsis cervina]
MMQAGARNEMSEHRTCTKSATLAWVLCVIIPVISNTYGVHRTMDLIYGFADFRDLRMTELYRRLQNPEPRVRVGGGWYSYAGRQNHPKPNSYESTSGCQGRRH